jgi:hypothetical protein
MREETENPLNRVGKIIKILIMKKLKNIKGLLSREEMKQIQGGCGWICSTPLCKRGEVCANGPCRVPPTSEILGCCP